jgi:hypothetical protein
LTFHLLLVYIPFMALNTEDIAVSFAGLTSRGKIPRWAKGFNASDTTLDELSHRKSLSGIVVVQDAGSKLMVHSKLMEHVREQISRLASHVWKSSDPVRLVLNFPSPPAPPEALTRALRLFPLSISRVEVAYGNEDLRRSLVKALAKYQIESEETKNQLVESEETKNDALSQAREVIAATRPLLTKRGRLSAKAVASKFDIPWTRFARQIGSTKQAVDKTPDSAALQPALRPYERVARLRAVLKDPDFRAWLNRANVHLDNQTPLGLIENGRVEIVADLVESMLTGTPS